MIFTIEHITFLNGYSFNLAIILWWLGLKLYKGAILMKYELEATKIINNLISNMLQNLFKLLNPFFYIVKIDKFLKRLEVEDKILFSFLLAIV